jgi:prepilin peptidase CpaA
VGFRCVHDEVPHCAFASSHGSRPDQQVRVDRVAAMMLLGFQSIFVLCICYTIVSDFRDLKIPNWVIISLVLTFAVFAAAYLEPRAALGHLIVAIFIFLLASAFFVANWVAGGDVKLLAATALWMGPEHAAYFTMLMALVGSALALALLWIRKYPYLLNTHIPNNWLLQRFTTLAVHGQCPYGVAIGVAALLAPSTLFLKTTIV